MWQICSTIKRIVGRISGACRIGTETQTLSAHSGHNPHLLVAHIEVGELLRLRCHCSGVFPPWDATTAAVEPRAAA
jgi:hypothetical protein